MTLPRSKIVIALLVGTVFGAAGHAILSTPAAPAASPTDTPTAAVDWKPEIDTIKGKLPDQSHAMQDVSYHFSNLWFAGQHENWPLANFYWSETKSHLHWAVRIIPVRKDNAGKEIKLGEILEGMENGPLKQLGDAIEAKDKDAFEKSYRFTMETCYGCHKAADKPFLHPQIPTQPESPIINFDPNADWPK